MKEKTLDSFIFEYMKQKNLLVMAGLKVADWKKISESHADHVREIALQEFKDEVITQINHAKDNFPSHSFDPEFTRGITKGFQMASAILNTKPTTPK